MEIYPYKLLLDGRICHVLWFTNEVDGVLLNETGQILNFESLELARTYLSNHNLHHEQRSAESLDLNWITDSRSFSSECIDCARTLEAWNFFADVAYSLPDRASKFLSKDLRPSKTYDKVFWGNNLPAMTPDGEHFIPAWSSAEVEELSAVLVCGLALLKSNLGPAAH